MANSIYTILMISLIPIAMINLALKQFFTNRQLVLLDILALLIVTLSYVKTP